MSLVEIEGASEALEPGTSVSVAATDTPIASAHKRKALVLANPSTTITVYLHLAETGAAVGKGIFLFPQTGIVLKEYHGAVCGISGSGTIALGYTEF